MRRFHHPFVGLAIALATMGGCSPMQEPVDIESTANQESGEQDDDHRFKDLEERDSRYIASFAELPDVMSKISDHSTLILYEGLPHQHFHKEEMFDELVGKECQRRHHYFFYKRPNTIGSTDAERLREIVINPDSFQVYGGFKPCGGFHPDFSLVWTIDDRTVEFHLCFGCHEAQMYFGDTNVYCEISDEGHAQLKSILEQYHEQIPDLG